MYNIMLFLAIICLILLSIIAKGVFSLIKISSGARNDLVSDK